MRTPHALLLLLAGCAAPDPEQAERIDALEARLAELESRRPPADAPEAAPHVEALGREHAHPDLVVVQGAGVRPYGDVTRTLGEAVHSEAHDALVLRARGWCTASAMLRAEGGGACPTRVSLHAAAMFPNPDGIDARWGEPHERPYPMRDLGDGVCALVARWECGDLPRLLRVGPAPSP